MLFSGDFFLWRFSPLNYGSFIIFLNFIPVNYFGPYFTLFSFYICVKTALLNSFYLSTYGSPLNTAACIFNTLFWAWNSSVDAHLNYSIKRYFSLLWINIFFSDGLFSFFNEFVFDSFMLRWPSFCVEGLCSSYLKFLVSIWAWRSYFLIV